VKQILNNVLSNAFKYTAEGRVTLSVFAEAGSEAESDVTFVFGVSDTGQGMTEEQVSHLFDEYARFNMAANRTTEGTGLGMNITRNLVRMMSGEIFVESAPGKGSTFTLRLPQQSVGPEVLGSELVENMRQFRVSSKEQMKRTQISREPMPYGSVLIVDDVETNLYVAKGLMSAYKLQIDTATSGFAALDKIRDGKTYDVVFMDHMMPKMDGIETTKKLRDLGYERPVVALTANAVAGQMEVFLANGFNDFISKPIDIRQLNIVLNKLVRDTQTPEVLEAARREAGDSTQDYADDDGQPRVDPQLAAFFVRDAERAIAVLEAACGNGTADAEESLRLYTIDAHAMKSALANIGEAELSKFAFRLEQAGRGRDLAVISAETPEFLDALRAVIRKITPQDEEELGDAQDEDQAYLREKLLALRTMCAEYDIGAAENALAELRSKTWSRQTRELLNALTEHLLSSELDEAAGAAKDYAESIRAE
jgi:CheY-like chemotaxis protein